MWYIDATGKNKERLDFEFSGENSATEIISKIKYAQVFYRHEKSILLDWHSQIEDLEEVNKLANK